MAKKKVVFIGSEHKLTMLACFHDPFVTNGWEVQDCRTMEEAQKISPRPDVLVVWAYGDHFTHAFEVWPHRPPTIWYTFSPFDKIPEEVVEHKAGTLPSSLYRTACALCR